LLYRDAVQYGPWQGPESYAFQLLVFLNLSLISVVVEKNAILRIWQSYKSVKDLVLEEINLQWRAILDFFAIDAEHLSDPDIMIRLAIQIGLLLCSAFFSGSETALFSLSRLDLERLRKKKHPQSGNLHELLDQPRRLIISILCGNELVNIAAAVNMTGLLLILYDESKAGWISILVMVPLILLFGEVTPKTIAVSNPVTISSSVVAYPLSIWVKLVTPIRWALRGISDRITTLIVGPEKAADNILQIDEFRSLVEEVADEGELDATERALIYNLLESGDTEIVEIMTPRTRVKFLNGDLSVPEMVELFKQYRHPRVPVFRQHRDNIIGFIHAEDILRLILDKVDTQSLQLQQIMHPPVVVPLTKKVDEMFEFFQSKNASAAAVLNEFGGVEGFLTMKDVLTFIFGHVSDDISGSELYRERDENTYVVPGEMKLNDFNNLTNFGIEDPRMTTIGGVAFRHLDHLPVVGDQVKVEGITITVVEMDVHRIAKVRVSSTGSGDQKIVTNEDQQENKSDGTEKGEIKPSEEAEAKSEQPETDSVQPDFAVSPTDIEQENTLTDGNVSAVLELAENSTTMESQQTSTEWQDGEPEKVISNNQEEQLSGKLNPETAVASTGQKR
jgi:putative hemolysin